MPTTFLQATAALARRLDDYAVYTVTSGGAIASTSLVVASLKDATNAASPEKFAGRWLYSNGEQQKGSTAGFVSSTGGITFHPPRVAAVGSTVATTGLFPVVAGGPEADTSYQGLLNAAMNKILVEDRVTLPITTAETYALTTWREWLDRPERLLRVLEPAHVGALPVDAGWRGWRLRLDAELPVLEMPVPFPVATGNLTLVVRRPVGSWIAVGGTWAESTVGFASDTDAADIGVEELVLVALVEAYQALMARSPGRPNGDWAKKYEDARTRAESLYHFDGAFYTRRSQAPADASLAGLEAA